MHAEPPPPRGEWWAVAAWEECAFSHPHNVAYVCSMVLGPPAAVQRDEGCAATLGGWVTCLRCVCSPASARAQTLTVPRSHRARLQAVDPKAIVPVAVAHGDGIGPEIMESTLRILEAAEVSAVRARLCVPLRGCHVHSGQGWPRLPKAGWTE